MEIVTTNTTARGVRVTLGFEELIMLSNLKEALKGSIDATSGMHDDVPVCRTAVEDASYFLGKLTENQPDFGALRDQFFGRAEVKESKVGKIPLKAKASHKSIAQINYEIADATANPKLVKDTEDILRDSVKEFLGLNNVTVRQLIIYLHLKNAGSLPNFSTYTLSKADERGLVFRYRNLSKVHRAVEEYKLSEESIYEICMNVGCPCETHLKANLSPLQLGKISEYAADYA